MKCSVDGCASDAKYVSVCLCVKHYLRLRRHGSPLSGGTFYGDSVGWLEQNIPSNTDDYVIWPYGRFSDGYAAVNIKGKKHRVSRYVCGLVNGHPSDADMDAAHSCGNGHLGCVNDRHMRWATRKENIADKVAHGTERLGEDRHNSKLSNEEAMSIFKMRGNGVYQKDIALRFGISRELVGQIQRKTAWSWIHDNAKD